jgi:hypothetical protein
LSTVGRIIGNNIIGYEHTLSRRETTCINTTVDKSRNKGSARYRHEGLHKLLMTMHRKSLGEEVCEEGLPRAPEHTKVSLTNTIPNPVIPHVHAFGTTLLNGIIG